MRNIKNVVRYSLIIVVLGASVLGLAAVPSIAESFGAETFLRKVFASESVETRNEIEVETIELAKRSADDPLIPAATLTVTKLPTRTTACAMRIAV